MSVTRLLCAAFASVTIVSAFWFQGTQVATPDSASAGFLAPVAQRLNNAPQDAGEVPPFKPVARISSLMKGIGTAFGKVRDVFPQTEEENRFDAINGWSEVIAELSNVHMRHRRKPAYIEMASNTRSIALELAREARADTPDEAQLGMLITQLDMSCATCHEADH